MPKYFCCCIFLILVLGKVQAQEKQIQGIIFDKNSKERIAKVYVSNMRSKSGIYNNLKGEFTVAVQLNDILIFSKTGYFNDTVKVTAFQSLPVYLKRSSIALREVTIKDTVLSAANQLQETKREFHQLYGLIANKELISIGTNGGGAGISIDALYNMLSRRGRNATKLRGIIERDYREKVIDIRFNSILVNRITGLQGDQLTSFMYRYRPDYNLVVLANDYDFVSYIKSCYNRFRRNPTSYFLAPLPTIK